MRKISSFIMACAMCLSMTVVGTVAPQVAVQAEETAAVELKEAPTTVPAVALDSDFFSGDTIYTLTYSVNEQNWIEAITSVEVNNQVYTKVSYSWDMGSNKYQASGSSYNVKIGKQAFIEDVNKVVISADGYKDLVLEVNKDGKEVAIHTKHTGGTATCTKKAVCKFCGEEYGEYASHNYGDKYESDGTYHWKKCQNEGCDATTKKEAHTGGTATCTKKAVCEFCGEEYGEYASHNYGDKYESDGTYHWKKCQNEGCDATTEKEAHTGGEATTTKRAVCEVCGAEYGDLKKEDSKPADKTTEGKKDDTKPADKTTESKKDDTKPAATTTVKNDTKPAEKPDKKIVKAKKVVVNKKSIVLKKGKKVKLKAKLKPANATEKVTFKSSNKKVAKVTKNGVVKAVKKGKCKITVKTASGKKAVVKVTVK